MDDVGLTLPSALNYKILDNKTAYYSDDKCNTLVDVLSEYNGVFDFCEKFIGIIENFNKLTIFGQFEDDSCITVKFWVYDRLFKLPINNTNVNDINKVILKLKENIDLDTIKECNIFNFTYSKEDFYIMKSLYDYATNYNTIKKYLYGKNYICKQNLKNYIDKNYEIYINVKDKCNSNDTRNDEYCTVYDYIKKVFINENSSLSCKVKHSEDDVSEKEHVTRRDEGLSPTLSNLGKRDEKISGINAITEHEKNSVPFAKIIVGVVFPLLGFFFILYKFTPFKSWLKTNLLKKKIIKDYEDEEYTQEPLNEYYSTRRRHVHYHPL
ncbi:PIR protein [Plasmodium malariae]|uniref:PIR protein n=1 Tax=Plasmodium malariae TaxID=5858 RepID=A0A1D3RJH8_PLAMA|nr:PIR protein [Plasmodium malariae]SCN45312.1 PIR protein [Plasmodium malariae]